MNNVNKSATLIQKWWKHHTSTFKLRGVKNYLESTLTLMDGLQSISNCCAAIARTCKGCDGNGLLSGSLIMI